jgi:hypothetical protein
MAAASLTRLRRAIRSTSMNYDRLAVAAARVADLMADELAEWRFVLESRRVRAHRNRSSTPLRRLAARRRKPRSDAR